MKKRSRVIDIQKNNQIENSFMGVPETDVPACFNKSTCSPAINKQQPPLGKSHLTLGDSLVRVLQKLRTSWITTMMASGTATVAQLYRMVQLINWGKNRGSDDAFRHQKLVQKLRLRGKSMRSMAGVHVYCSVAKVSVRGTDRLHYTDGRKNTVSCS